MRGHHLRCDGLTAFFSQVFDRRRGAHQGRPPGDQVGRIVTV
jgi:hypothetical protein